MNISSIITQTLSAVFCLGIVGSLVLHDTNIDKATLVAADNRIEWFSAPVTRPGNMPHTHSERASLYQAIRDLHSSQPRTQPRSQYEKKYVQSKPSARGHHPFDNYSLPVVS